ncbi:condensation domain-containing protein, partial [Actinophytocola sp.]|uniref:condensation domain-containing protein n=1 Tax=Actinophytocola sp. TaxID=1872138 RepID=UPI00389988FA
MPDTTEAGGLVARLARLDPERRRLLTERLRPGPVALPRDGRPLPASFFQERLWLVDQLLPGSTAYVVAVTQRLRGDLDCGVLSRAWELLVDRHEALRTRLEWVDGVLTQSVLPAVSLPLRVIDLTDVEDVRSEVARLLDAEAAVGLDLSSAPLFRLRLLRLATRDHVLAVYLHHAVTDGWSNGILMRELSVSYRTLLAGGEPVLPPLRLQYADAAAWQRDQLTEQRLADLSRYWTDRLAGAPDLLDLPTDRPRQAGGARPVARHHTVLPRDSVTALRALADSERTTVFAVLLAGFAAILARWAGRQDIVVGSPRTGRTHPDLEGVV